MSGMSGMSGKTKGKVTKTQRSRVVKLELSNDSKLAVNKVGSTLFNLSDSDINIIDPSMGQLRAAVDNNVWHQTGMWPKIQKKNASALGVITFTTI